MSVSKGSYWVGEEPGFLPRVLAVSVRLMDLQ